MTDMHSSEAQGASTSRERGNGSAEYAKRSADTAKEKLHGFANRQKDAGLDHISEVANAAHKTADSMRGENAIVADLVQEAASGLDRLTSNLRGRDVSEVYSSVHDFARRQPLAFVAGSFAAGLLLARFLKSSPPSADAGQPPYHPSPNL